jgi:hypothetical protein
MAVKSFSSPGIPGFARLSAVQREQDVVVLVDGVRLVYNGLKSIVDTGAHRARRRIGGGRRDRRSGQEVERRLRAALGEPSRTDDGKEGCSLAGEAAVPRRHFVWEALEVVVSNPGTSNRQARRLDGPLGRCRPTSLCPTA